MEYLEHIFWTFKISLSGTLYFSFDIKCILDYSQGKHGFTGRT